MKAFLKKILVFFYHMMARILPLNGKKAMFMSNMGRNYSGNPRAVFEAMKADVRFTGVKKIWAFNGDYPGKACGGGKGILPSDCIIVRYGGLRYYFHMATSKIWVFDTRQEPYLVKRKKAVYLMTWHGTPLKKLGLDITNLNMSGEKRDLKAYRDSFLNEAAKWDYLLVQNDFSEKVLPRCFGFGNTVLKTGYPRNDRLCTASETEKGPTKKKTLLFAPTWRDDEYLGNGFYRAPLRPDFLKLERLLSDNYRIIVKLHYLVKVQEGDFPKSCIENGFIEVIGNETDIADLYLGADGLITDYSSVFFDYSILLRPIFFFCYDLEKYRDELRGFYLPFEELAPGAVCLDEETLAQEIRECFEGNGNRYIEKLKSFKEEYNGYDDGQASAKALDVLYGHIKEAGR